MAALAKSLSWQFVAESDDSYDDKYSQFDVFCRGHSRYAYNTLRGTAEIDGQSCPAVMGDFHYRVTSGAGKNRRTHSHHFSYLIIDLPYASLPDLRIRGEGVFDALAKAFGFDDIDFESAEFSKRFHVKSSDKKFAYDVIHPAMMEFLLATEPPTVEIEANHCCVTAGNDTWSASEFRDRLHWSMKFFDIWPKHLVSALKSR